MHFNFTGISPYSTARTTTLEFLVGAIVVLTLIEMVFSYLENRKYYQKQDTLTNIYLNAVTLLINLGAKGATFLILNYCYGFRFFTISNRWWYWVVLIVVQDFLYWFLHYVGHYCRLFWAMHVTHHSSEHFNFTTGFRSTVFEPLYRVFFYIPLAFMGFSAIDILYAYLVTQIYGNLVHTQVKIDLPRWYSYLFVTPAHHRVHHASNIPYLDKNMGMVLIVWDRLFGTFQEELHSEETHYGLTKQPDDMGPVNVIFHEWKAMWSDIRQAPTFSAKLGYIFMPPGWSHDGRTQTARVLQREYFREKQV